MLKKIFDKKTRTISFNNKEKNAHKTKIHFLDKNLFFSNGLNMDHFHNTPYEKISNKLNSEIVKQKGVVVLSHNMSFSTKKEKEELVVENIEYNALKGKPEIFILYDEVPEIISFHNMNVVFSDILYPYVSLDNVHIKLYCTTLSFDYVSQKKLNIRADESTFDFNDSYIMVETLDIISHDSKLITNDQTKALVMESDIIAYNSKFSFNNNFIFKEISDLDIEDSFIDNLSVISDCYNANFKNSNIKISGKPEHHNFEQELIDKNLINICESHYTDCIKNNDIFLNVFDNIYNINQYIFNTKKSNNEYCILPVKEVFVDDLLPYCPISLLIEKYKKRDNKKDLNTIEKKIEDELFDILNTDVNPLDLIVQDNNEKYLKTLLKLLKNNDKLLKVNHRNLFKVCVYFDIEDQLEKISF